MSSLAETLAGLSPEQRRLLEARLRKKGIEISRFQITPRAEERDAYPLGFAQRRLWFLHQLAPESSAYHIFTPIRLRGSIDRRLLARALDAIVERHESLRTTFRSQQGQPVQVVHPPRRQALPEIDLSGLGRGRRGAEMYRLLVVHREVPFDLGEGPLLRTALIRLGGDNQVFLVTMHHVIADGWSLMIFNRELLALYQAFVDGRPAPLKPLPVQYVDYALWQEKRMREEGYDALLAYWKERLAGAKPVLELPTDRPRPPVLAPRGKAVKLRLAPRLAAPLRRLARDEAATLYVVALAAFDVLLARTTGEDDVVVGTPTANRGREEIEGLIGFFANTLVLRNDLGGDPTFRALVGRVRETNAGANAHQDLPFEKLVDELSPDRSLQRNPLFQVTLSIQNDPGAEADGAGAGTGELAVSTVNPETTTSMFDLSAVLTETPEMLVGDLIFNAHLFDSTTIERLARHYESLLAGVADDPDRRLSQLPFLTVSERHQLLAEWKAPPQVQPAAPTPLLHRLVEAPAERHPGRTAVVCDGRELTYGELDARANRLARFLSRRGVGPEVIVGLCLERSTELVVGILGILKAGGAYLPLDPTAPAPRLAFMLDDAQSGAAARLAVTEPGRLAELAGRVELVCLDGEEIARQEATAPETAVRPENAAYVIYTSGSTGTPKGVVVAHREIAERLWHHPAADGLKASDVFLQRTSVSFDVSLVEIFAPLAVGSRTILPRPGGHQDLEYLDRLITEQRITHVSFPPPMLDVLLELGAVARWPNVWHVSTGGETVPVELPRRFYGVTSVRLVNRYGPTETTVSTLAWNCREAASERYFWRLPIGRPLARAEVYVTDPRLAPAAIGIAGEIVIGGHCLARGYLHRPRRTAEVFVPDPLGGETGARLYRTGDLARWRPDGAVDFLGRVDRQVKVRGFRVELGEIEAALREHPAVADVAVVDYREPSGTVQLAAYVAAGPGEAPAAQELRAHLGATLPAYMVPADFVALSSLPYLPSGKVDRRALPTPERRGAAGAERVAPRDELESTLAEVWREVLGVEDVGVHDNFFDLGGHSLLLVQVQSRLRDALGRDVAIMDLFRHPTLADLAGCLRPRPAGGRPAARPDRGRRRAELRRGAAGRAASEIAVVGMACRFPGAAGVDELWTNLRDGVESVRFFTAEELIAAGLPPALVESPSYVRAWAMLDGMDRFDAGLFGMSPREAQIADPQQRLFLECAWEALEKAACDPEAYAGAIGVYAGTGAPHHWVALLRTPEVAQTVGELGIALGNEKDFLPTQTSYRLDLQGPSVNVQTACSTALVAAHLACQSLSAGECDMALAGGVSAISGHAGGYFYEEGGVVSPDGHCRAFDARGKGTVGGHGVGVVVLKRLADALADGDPIHAVIKGSAINNDGSHKVGFTAPSIAGQSAVISEALEMAGVGPETVTYVEAHGTATPLGDPIEVAALTEVFGNEPGERCALGSVKTNFGHLNAAAGAAGLIKAVLALEHRQIPPSLHFEEPNPEIDFESSPFFVVTELRDWKPLDGLPRRAGVSSFGLGGTNAHLVLEEAPAPPGSGPSRPWQLLVQSAKTPSALDTLTDRLADHLASRPDDALADVAHTLRVGRRRLPARQILVCRDAGDAAAALEKRDPLRLLRTTEERKDRPVAFLLPGVGDHYVGMGRELYDTEPTFRREIDRAAEALAPYLELDLRQMLYPERPADEERAPHDAPATDLRRLLGRNREGEDEAARRLDRTRLAQPAVFAVEHALARLWMEWGVRPEALIGYSLGELTAACLAGVFSLGDALALVADRARWIDELPEGAMLAVPLAADDVSPLLGDELSLAAYNAPEVSVVAGPPAAVEALAAELGERDVVSQRLRSTHAFHSRMMEPLAARLAERVRRIELSPPEIPYLSNVTGTWMTDEDALDPEYWARHLCRPVRFAQGLEELFAGAAGRVLLEVGPGQALGTAARQHPARGAGVPVYTSLRDGRDRRSDVAFLLETAGKLWLDGVRIDAEGFARHEQRRRLELPTYPFERQTYRIEPQGSAAPPPRAKKADVGDWFYVPSWKPTPPPAPLAAAAEGEPGWLVFLDDGGLGTRVAQRLSDSGRDVTLVRRGSAFARLGDGFYEIDPRSRDDYGKLLAALDEETRPPGRVAHFWSVGRSPEAPFAESFDEAQARGLYSLLYLSQALIERVPPEPVVVSVVSNGAQRADGREEIHPEKATMLGALRVIPQEYRDLPCRSIDVTLAEPGSRREEELAEDLAAELAGGASDVAVAYRGGGRRVQGFEAVRVPAETAVRPPLRRRGVYLVTGGLGNIGLSLAQALGRELEARLVLTGRSPFPGREEWDAWLESHGEDDETALRIRLFRELEEAGAEIVVESADAADREAMAAVVERTAERFGGLHGVIHLAGSIGDGLRVAVEEAGPEDCRRHFASKVEGTRVLEEILADRDLDFCYLFSSLSTVLGGLGFVAYTAANSYLDAVAEKRGADGRFPWISADWDGWPRFAEAQRDPDAEPTVGAMKQAEAVDAFRRVMLLRGSPRVVVSTVDLGAQLRAWIEGDRAEEESAAPDTSPRADRPELKTPYVAPSNEAEETLAGIWQQLLGFARIGIHDNYFELGGDSLLATRMLSTVRRQLRVQLTLRHLFDNPTIAGLASIVETSEEDPALSRLEALLSEVENMSPEEVARKSSDGRQDEA